MTEILRGNEKATKSMQICFNSRGKNPATCTVPGTLSSSILYDMMLRNEQKKESIQKTELSFCKSIHKYNWGGKGNHPSTFFSWKGPESSAHIPFAKLSHIARASCK